MPSKIRLNIFPKEFHCYSTANYDVNAGLLANNFKNVLQTSFFIFNLYFLSCFEQIAKNS